MKIPFWSNDGMTTAPAPARARPVADPGAAPPDEEAIRGWLSARLAQLVGIEPKRVQPDYTFAEYGLDSMQAVRLSGDLEDWLGRELPPVLLYDYPTIAALARHLAGAPDLAAVSMKG